MKYIFHILLLLFRKSLRKALRKARRGADWPSVRDRRTSACNCICIRKLQKRNRKDRKLLIYENQYKYKYIYIIIQKFTIYIMAPQWHQKQIAPRALKINK